MAGSFGIFRQYEKAALAGLAIMAMLAFFVLPPFLQMGTRVGGSDPLAVSWTGGGLKESDLQRAVITRRVVNRFLAEILQASGQSPSRLQIPDDEQGVVDTMLLAREAERNGIVVGNAAVNQFLAEVTNNLVPRERCEAIISEIGGRTGVSQQDVFEALRTWLMALRTQDFLGRGVSFEGAPPGWRWDLYRRLEQSATIETVPVVVNDFIDKVPEPTEADLRALFEKYDDELPSARSPNPGFRQPHRVRYDSLVAKAGTFVDEEKANVTEERIKEYYEEHKAELYKGAAAAEKPAEAKADATAAKADATETKADAEATDPAGGGEKAAAPEKPSADTPTATPAAKEGAGEPRLKARSVAFRQPAPTAPAAAAGTAPGPGTAASSGAESGKDEAAAKAAAEAPGDGTPAAAATDESVTYQPLDEVRDDVVARLAREAAEKRIDAIFSKVRADVATYEELDALWQANGKPEGKGPVPPDVRKIAEIQRLEGGTSDLVSANQAYAAGGIGGSFDFVISREFGVRQLRWLDMMFGTGVQLLQTVASRDVEGNRYLSWKTEDQPEFTPSFQAARDDVLHAWRIIEARPAAIRAAEAIAAEVKGGKALDQITASRENREVAKVGPFTWLTRGTAPFGSAPELSQPDGLAMPGAEFMRTVFALEPGQTAVAFNEPKTVCYVVRLVAFEPDDARLKDLFLASSQDPRRIAAVADDDTRDVFVAWMESIRRRDGVAWVRPPRAAEPL